jgi:hypothetical protein
MGERSDASFGQPLDDEAGLGYRAGRRVQKRGGAVSSSRPLVGHLGNGNAWPRADRQGRSCVLCSASPSDQWNGLWESHCLGVGNVVTVTKLWKGKNLMVMQSGQIT